MKDERTSNKNPSGEKSLLDTLIREGTPSSREKFSLEEILAEYGESLEQHLLRQAEQKAAEKNRSAPPEPSKGDTKVYPIVTPPLQPEALAPSPEKQEPPSQEPPPTPERAEPLTEHPPQPEEPPAAKLPVPPPETPAVAPKEKAAGPSIDVEELKLPESPRPVSLEEVVNSTVEAVMEEEREPLLPPRRGLFSRQKLEDSERLPPPPEPEPEYDPEPIGPEPDLRDVAQDCRQAHLARRRPVLIPLFFALAPTALLLADRQEIILPFWTGDPKAQSAILLFCLAATALLCRHVFVKGFSMLRRRRCVSELLVSLSALAAAGDCILCSSLTERSVAAPYAAVSCLALVFAQWGVRRECRGDYDMFRCAAMDSEPPYLITDTQRGACKQRGAVPGFYTTAARDNISTLWQTALLPVFGVAAFVFAGLSSLGQGRKGDFLLNLSAILAAAATFSLPLCWSLPWSRLAGHLQKTGAAVAGWSGARKISRRRSMIVTDGDLFPPGTIRLNGRKVYGEDPVKALSYGASMARAAGCGLERMFNNLIRSEGGAYEPVEDFSFYEEGGYSGMIHGESVLMGTGSFLRKMDVRLPGDVNLKTGVFLAVDKHLIAVFAVKYNPAENVDFALKMMRRSRILPILASRDPNITPALIRRKFSKGVKLEYPSLTDRVALSEAEKDRDLPRALLFREGLLPYAETVAGSLRLCKAVRWATALSLLGSWTGTLLTFYLVSLGAYSLMNPLALELFLLLWTLPALLMAGWTGRY